MFIGKRLVKKDLIKIKGDIPIYSANVFNPIGYHNKSNVNNFDSNFVTWGIDGDFEFNFIEKNSPFVTTDHCGAIRILTDDILPEYLMLQLSKVKHKYGFDRGLRSSLKNMSQVFVEIPIDSDGIFDLKFQQDVLEKYQVVKETKQKVEEYKKQVHELNVEIEISNHTFKEVIIKNLFDIERGLSKYTKAYGNKNKGSFPVFSASNNAPLTFIDTFDHDGKYLTWATNGFAGYIKITAGKFSINGDRGLFNPKKKNINLYYVKSKLEPILREMAKGRKGERGENEFTKVYPSMVESIKIQIPIDQNGELDLQAQKETAEKYKKVAYIKSEINKELDVILDLEIDI